jgi:hypothetical protein
MPAPALRRRWPRWASSRRSIRSVGGLGRRPSAAGSLDEPALGPDDEVTRKLGAFSNPTASDAYLRGLGLHLRVVYQPAGRFWRFQMIEASLFVGLAATILAIAIWRLHHRGKLT